jgi:hypothetical protein
MGFLSRLRNPERRFVELLERARVTIDPGWRQRQDTVDDPLAMWECFLRMRVWVLISDGGDVFAFDLGGIPTGMAAFDEQVLRDWSESNPSLDGVGTT